MPQSEDVQAVMQRARTGTEITILLLTLAGFILLVALLCAQA